MIKLCQFISLIKYLQKLTVASNVTFAVVLSTGSITTTQRGSVESNFFTQTDTGITNPVKCTVQNLFQGV